MAVETLAEAEELNLILSFGSCPEAPRLGLLQPAVVDQGSLNLGGIIPNLTVEHVESNLN